MLVVLGIGLLAGLLIGSVGVGGVIVAPALAYVVGVEVHTAIACALLGFGFSGLVGTFRYAQQGAIEWPRARTLAIAALPAAIAGAYLVYGASPYILKCLLGCVVTAAGLHGIIRGGQATVTSGAPMSDARLRVIGATTGFLSVITGTGGPLVLVPTLVFFQQSILTAVGLSQIIQLPIAAAATGVNFSLDLVDVPLSIGLAVSLAIGTWAGSHLAFHVPARALRTTVFYLLIAIGIAIVADVSRQFIS